MRLKINVFFFIGVSQWEVCKCWRMFVVQQKIIVLRNVRKNNLYHSREKQRKHFLIDSFFMKCQYF